MYYKILQNNQIIDVMEQIRFIKYLPKSKKNIIVDHLQANGIISSDGNNIYHILGTINNFPEKIPDVLIEEISQEEYLKLTTQIQENKNLEKRIEELEKIIQQLLK